MILILKLIAYTMAAYICSKLFPTFWGGFYTMALFIIVNSVSVVVNKTKNEVDNE